MQELVAELRALASQEGFAYWAAQATMWHGWTLSIQGQHADGIAQMLRGLTARYATGASLYRAAHLALLAEAYGQAGQIDEGLVLTGQLILERRYRTRAGGVFLGTGRCHDPVVTFVRPRIGRKSSVLRGAARDPRPKPRLAPPLAVRRQPSAVSGPRRPASPTCSR